MNLDDIIRSFTNVLILIPHIFVLLICFYYLIRKQAIDSILLTAGSLISLFCIVFNIFITPMLINSGNMSNISLYFGVVAVISFIATFLFAIGLLILVNRVFRSRNATI